MKREILIADYPKPFYTSDFVESYNSTPTKNPQKPLVSEDFLLFLPIERNKLNHKSTIFYWNSDTYCMLTYCLRVSIINLRWCIYATA